MPASRTNEPFARGGAGHAHDEGEIRDEPVGRAEDGRPEGPGAAGAVPLLAGRDVAGLGVHAGPGGRHAGRCSAPAQPLPDLGVLSLVGGDRRDLGRRLGVVELLLVALERLDHVAHGMRAESAGEEEDRPDAQPRPARLRDDRAELAQLARPDLGVATLVARDRAERVGAARVLLDPGQAVVQGDRVALQLEVAEALGDIDRGHGLES